MSWNPEDNFSDSDEEDENEDTRGREAYIFVVDALLFQKYELFKNCLEVIREALFNGLLTREKDFIGMIFNNTEKTPPPKDPAGMENIVTRENTATFLPLRPLSKEAVDYFLHFSALDDFDFENKYGCKEGNFANMIWLCTNMFQQCGYKLSMPTIVYFTDLETPHAVDTTEYQQALRKAKDLNEINVDFTVVPMQDEFNYNIFYKEFFCTATDTELDSFRPEKPQKVRVVIANRMVQRNFQTRCTSYVHWKIDQDLNIPVGVYNFFKRNVYPQPVRIFRDDNSLLETKVVYKISSMADIEEKVCLPSDQRKQITVGGTNVCFTNEELHQMKCPMEPGIQLLGFKPRETVNQQYFIKSVSFIFPNEKQLVGSTKLFRALWEKCLQRNKIAFCVFVAKRNSSPQYVALIPVGNESGDPSMNGMYSEGFHIWYLPWQYDIRRFNFPERPVHEDSEQEVDLMMKLTRKLKINYTPESFKDPALNALRSNIIDVVFDIESQSLPDLNSVNCMGVDEEHLKQVIHTFKEDLECILPDPESENVAQKRRLPGNQNQRSKAARTESTLTREVIESHITNETLQKLTVKDLKEYLQANNVTGISSATKPVLIEKVLQLHRNA